ncbi:MAG: hypothetical protein U9R49_01140, partial [Bacteroidota bacterium]|nr:hypothetical protein [Bacteroidota bacterium]
IVMEKVGSKCDLFLYEGEGHGFFNYRNYEIYTDTREKTEVFLISTGFIRDTSKYRVGYPMPKPAIAGDGSK